MKKILVFICLALCMMLLVCSCGGGNDTDTNTNTDTDTNTDTQASTNTDTSTDTDTDTDTDTNDTVDTGINLNDGKYRVFVCNKNGEGIADAFVQYCLDDSCTFGATDANGYIEIPSGEYHIQRVEDTYGVYEPIVYEAGSEPHFESDSKLITITLTKK